MFGSSQTPLCANGVQMQHYYAVKSLIIQVSAVNCDMTSSLGLCMQCLHADEEDRLILQEAQVAHQGRHKPALGVDNHRSAQSASVADSFHQTETSLV